MEKSEEKKRKKKVKRNEESLWGRKTSEREVASGVGRERTYVHVYTMRAFAPCGSSSHASLVFIYRYIRNMRSRPQATVSQLWHACKFTANEVGRSLYIQVNNWLVLVMLSLSLLCILLIVVIFPSNPLTVSRGKFYHVRINGRQV